MHDPGVKAIVLDFDWRASHRIIDVGGAYGSAVAEILKEHKNLEGVLMDQPQVRLKPHEVSLLQ